MGQWQLKHRCVAAVLLLWLLIAAASHADEQVVLIAHPSVALEDINKDRLRAIFAMRETRWSDDSPVRVFVLPDQHPVHRQFCKDPLSIYPFILRRHWDRLTFTGTGPMPAMVTNQTDMLEKVSQTPGSLGYVRKSMITDAVKILRITQTGRDRGDPQP